MKYDDLQKEFEKNIKNTKAMLDDALKKIPVNDRMKKASECEFNLSEYSKNILKIHEQYKKNGLKGN